jgi:ABC-type dipeptide/oligopeptide/nickel transport system permease component
MSIETAKLSTLGQSDLAALLTLEEVAADRFRTKYGDVNLNGRSYGGQLLGQAMMAAYRTAPRAEISRQLRGALIELLSSQQVRTLHAKGLTPSVILWKHGLRNVDINLLTVIALLANRMLAATVVIEAVLAVPGLGGLIVNAALQRDFPIVQGVILVMVGIVLLINLATDMLYGLIDPRVR